MKIAMIGSGAAGSVFASYLRRGGADMTLVDVYKAHMDKVAADGMTFRIDPDQSYHLDGFKTAYSADEIAHILEELDHQDEYGFVLRAKGMVPGADGTWTYFDYVPEESNVRSGSPCVTGKICVIGSNLKEDKLAELFGK